MPARCCDAAPDAHHDDAWVVTRDADDRRRLVRARGDRRGTLARLGDVALVARDDVAFHDPLDTGPYQLVGRHGSLTSAEMYVPLLAATR